MKFYNKLKYIFVVIVNTMYYLFKFLLFSLDCIEQPGEISSFFTGTLSKFGFSCMFSSDILYCTESSDLRNQD